jgi:hypothetical protein
VRVVDVQKGPYGSAAGVRWAERYERGQGRSADQQRLRDDIGSRYMRNQGGMLAMDVSVEVRLVVLQVPERPFSVCISKPCAASAPHVEHWNQRT